MCSFSHRWYQVPVLCSVVIFQNYSCQNPGSGGIRTHAPEETGALIQRLGPLGHTTSLRSSYCTLHGDRNGNVAQWGRTKWSGSSMFPFLMYFGCSANISCLILDLDWRTPSSEGNIYLFSMKKPPFTAFFNETNQRSFSWNHLDLSCTFL